MKTVLAACVLCVLSSSEAFAAERPNIVVCIADDISWDDFGCYGSRTARTPRIDALAANGLRFTEAYLTASSCSPSRSSIITGRYPHNLGPAAELHQPIAANIPWLPTVLREHGYYTAVIGKNHMTRENAKVGAETWDLIDPGVTPDNHGAEAKWVQTIEQRPKDKPFFFWFAAVDAHRGWDANKEWVESKYGPQHRPQDITVPSFLADDAATREDLASYHNEVTRFDYFVGQVADALAAQGVLDNTLLLVLADNGRPFPRAKTRLHDSGMKTALVAHWPAGIAKRGSTSASLVSVIDIAPTLLELAGVKSPPPSFQGLSFAPVLRDPQNITRRHAFSEHNWHDYEAHGRAVRSDGWLYIRNARPALAWQGPADSVRSPAHAALKALRDANKLTPAQADVFLAPRPNEELYLTAKDPEQLRNLATDPAHAAIKTRLAALLDQWIDETGDAVPDKLTADTFDRESGDPLDRSKTNAKAERGEFPGKPKNAARINAPGPQ
ncbi:Arylsulfatase [Anatilimnocola aggregata]|uniref:Arylsulfatase n=1 Tax=Anatilimnocola aggregata TaxID=2528021 RepID=A0A517Y8D2_9BACT|nr:sulfatase [Anatilimnocola aggregata]QDU26461.1 Arylsulfatase [Anatilimnocola aggregata]